MIAAEIARAKQREQIAAFDAAEAAMAESIAAQIGPDRPLTDDAALAVARFVNWCNARGVRYCPAKPATVAAFVIEAAPATVLDILRAIAQMHDAYRFANPVACAVVARALEQRISVDPPRGWPKADKVAFLILPPGIQEIVARRESERDRELRRIQSDAAKRKKEPEHAEA